MPADNSSDKPKGCSRPEDMDGAHSAPGLTASELDVFPVIGRLSADNMDNRDAVVGADRQYGAVGCSTNTTISTLQLVRDATLEWSLCLG